MGGARYGAPVVRDNLTSAPERKEHEKNQLLNELESLAKARGYSLEDFLGKQGKTAAGKKVSGTRKSAPVKYRDPENSALAWSGRGRQPKWVVDRLAKGKTLDDLKAAAA